MGALLTTRKLAQNKGKPKVRADWEDRFEQSLAGCSPFALAVQIIEALLAEIVSHKRLTLP